MESGIKYLMPAGITKAVERERCGAGTSNREINNQQMIPTVKASKVAVRPSDKSPSGSVVRETTSRVKVYFLFVVVLWLGAFQTYGQQLDALAEKDSTRAVGRKKESTLSLPDGKEIEIIQMVQLWDVQTFENQVTADKGTRNDLFIRRGRLGARGKIRQDVTATVIFAYDGIGRQKNTAGYGGTRQSQSRR